MFRRKNPFCPPFPTQYWVQIGNRCEWKTEKQSPVVIGIWGAHSSYAKTAVFLDVTLCSLIVRYHGFSVEDVCSMLL
jgi:hypothetical protein